MPCGGRAAGARGCVRAVGIHDTRCVSALRRLTCGRAQRRRQNVARLAEEGAYHPHGRKCRRALVRSGLSPATYRVRRSADREHGRARGLHRPLQAPPLDPSCLLHLLRVQLLLRRRAGTAHFTRALSCEQRAQGIARQLHQRRVPRRDPTPRADEGLDRSVLELVLQHPYPSCTRVCPRPRAALRRCGRAATGRPSRAVPHAVQLFPYAANAGFERRAPFRNSRMGPQLQTRGTRQLQQQPGAPPQGDR